METYNENKLRTIDQQDARNINGGDFGISILIALCGFALMAGYSDAR
ncbi:hypothetical protein [Zobellia barbeyronii]|uniref:Class IIb bacteriocin, lactobin A/cerein 7B family n=1 Tax=Zobellia barbeyronii TaxID=2748009 RepID=A0ABS5WAZ3_9FLAO|nr:hypothetical protein [Zobellia barbeyronii]MBT2160512.1 hypothetical protein [Zobellia barbeyronii]MBT2163668.1 hypothetical protein [Zobellia barbeyronii]